MKPDFDVLLAGCTTVYLEDFESEQPALRQKQKSSGRLPVERTIERVLATLEADLRLANLGAAWLPK